MRPIVILLLIGAGLVCCLLIVTTQTATGESPALQSNNGSYAYSSPEFRQLLDDSFRETGRGRAEGFYAWLSQANRAAAGRLSQGSKLPFDAQLARKKQELSQAPNTSTRAKAEVATAVWLHKMVKVTIPRYSLERGFEFSNVMRRQERQCFSQSVLITALLQEMGVNAGVVMINRNSRGRPTNNGHAVVLVKLADGKDLIVDASHREPFVRQQGLFVRAPGYLYVKPVYQPGSSKISRYLLASGSGPLATSKVQALDYDFVRSQFYYYRGERAAGGLRTRSGLARMERQLKRSVALCPSNPLAVYLLGRVHLAKGDSQAAARELSQAQRLYRQFGWVPSGVQQYLAQTRQNSAILRTNTAQALRAGRIQFIS